MNNELYQNLKTTFENSMLSIPDKEEGLRLFGLWITGYLHDKMSDEDFDTISKILKKCKFSA